MNVDTVVVGAGLSGLVCARRLQEAGVSVRVVEARDRVGGRTLSEAIGRGTFDLGGQWIGPGQDRVESLARELGLETFPTWARGQHVLSAGGRRRTYSGTIPRISALGLAGLGLALARLEILGRRIPTSEPWRARHAREWDAQSLEVMARSLRDGAARAAFDAALRTVLGAEAREVSLLHFGWYTRAGGGFLHLVEVHGGAQERRFVRGAQALSLGLAERVGPASLALAAPVRAVRQSESHVEVVTERETVSARLAVVTVPPPLCAGIAFEPGLPASRARLIERSTMGVAIKVVALYDRPFWRDVGLSGQAVFGSPPLSVVFDNTSHDGAQASLVAFVVGEPARAWRERTPEERRAAVLGSLAEAFGDAARTPTGYVEQDWTAEPYSRGGPVALFPCGLLSEDGPALRAPCGRIHWAGTESATRYPGYLEGAIQAGERAAGEVLARR